MRTSIGVVAGCVAAALTAATVAQDQRPLREARSVGDKFVLRVEPGRPGLVGRNCAATLTTQAEPGQSRRRVWERPLVNDVAPGRVFIRADGRFVITLDEFRRGGAQHALVVYGAKGELRRHFVLADLLEKADWRHVKVAAHEVLWLTGARCAFTAKGDAFEIDLPWGRKIRLDLQTLQLVRPDGSPVRVDVAAIPPAISAELFGSPGEREPAAGEHVAELAEMNPSDQAQTEEIARQLSAQHEYMPTAEPAVEPAAEPTADAQPAQPPEEPPAVALPPAGPDADLVATMANVVVPAPNAAEKVDYVAWFNELGRVAGPDADPLYQAAGQQFVPWTGSAELLSAAERGEPDALGGQEIGAWLAANAGALATFAEASQYGTKGWNYASDDGSMIGVLLPNLAPLRSLAKADVTLGRRLALEGRGEEAAQRYLDVLSAGAHVGSGLTLIENLVGVAVQNLGTDAFLDLQAGPAGESLDYTQLAADAAAAYRPLRPAVDAVQAERAAFMDAAQRAWNLDPQTGTYVLNPAAVRKFLGYVSDDATQVDAQVAQLADVGYEETVAEGRLYYDALTEALAQPYPDASRQLEQMESLMGSSATANPFLRALTPSVSRYLFVRTRADATRRAALLVTNLHAYRQVHGEYPAMLDTVAPPEPAVDPFSGAGFVYQRSSADFVLYSVGGNGQDDGGVHDRKGETNDLVFWPRPK